VDGSSTVYPITQAAGAGFRRHEGQVQLNIAFSGTSGGFRKFCAGTTDINDASRPINAEEAALCAKNGVDYVELPIAYDGMAVVVHPKNTWATSLTVAELKKMWEPAAQGTITRWSQIRPEWPDRELHLFGAGVDSGTYDYFTDAIVGQQHVSRKDYTGSEDDNVLVRGVAGDENALGFFGLSYFESNRDKLKIVAIDDGKLLNGEGPIAPSRQTVTNGSYQPLSRPLFIYVARKSFDRPLVAQFVSFFFEHGEALVSEAGAVPLTPRLYDLAKRRADRREVGTVFGSHGSEVGVSMESLLSQE